MPRCFPLLACGSLLAATLSAQPPAAPASSKPQVDALIPWLLREETQLQAIPFPEVILDATGKKVIATNLQSAVDRRVIRQISSVLDEDLRRVNAPGNGIENIARINEVSSHFEDLLRELLNAAPGLTCNFPPTADGRVQRSGYPDLRLVDEETKRVFYLDPKLYAAGSRESSFRTFYFEPQKSTNKVLDDAVHLVVGFEHQPGENGRWKFTRWDLVDLAHFQVRLKAEFQGSNRDIYRPDAIVATSAE